MLTSIGTYVRTRSIDRLIDAVVLANPSTTTQIVSLGAGTDTRFFNLQVWTCTFCSADGI